MTTKTATESSVPMDAMLTARDVAELTRISPVQVYRLARQGEFPSVRIGGCVRFARADIERLTQPASGQQRSSYEEGRCSNTGPCPSSPREERRPNALEQEHHTTQIRPGFGRSEAN